MPTTRRKRSLSGQKPSLVIRKVRGMGRGVFAGRDFPARALIEVCPVLILPPGTEEKDLGDLRAYVFAWGAAGDGLAIALGYGSLYNHSANPNAEFDSRHGRGEIAFRATRAIAAGEQILIDYGWGVADCAAFGLPAPPSAEVSDGKNWYQPSIA